MDDLSRLILEQLKAVNSDVGQFVTGILCNDISRDDQIVFARRLVGIAEHIKERACNTVGMVVEGSVVDDHDDHALPSGTNCGASHTGTTGDD